MVVYMYLITSITLSVLHILNLEDLLNICSCPGKNFTLTYMYIKTKHVKLSWEKLYFDIHVHKN